MIFDILNILSTYIKPYIGSIIISVITGLLTSAVVSWYHMKHQHKQNIINIKSNLYRLTYILMNSMFYADKQFASALIEWEGSSLDYMSGKGKNDIVFKKSYNALVNDISLHYHQTIKPNQASDFWKNTFNNFYHHCLLLNNGNNRSGCKINLPENEDKYMELMKKRHNSPYRTTF